MLKMKDKIIELKNVYFKYPQAQDYTLNDISLEMSKGEFIALLGSNGSGKSTFSKLLNSIFLPEKGQVIIDGLDTSSPDNTVAIRKKIGIVFQNPDNQIIANLVEDDVAFALENEGVERDIICQRIDSALEQVGMSDYKKKDISKLSGGQKQKVAIAGILASSVNCIIFDESTSMLDPQARKEVIKVMKQLNETGITIILITHYMEEAAHADRVIILNNGKIEMDNTPEVVFGDIEKIKKYGLEIPVVIDFVNRLRENGIPIKQNVLLEEDCINTLDKLCTKYD